MCNSKHKNTNHEYLTTTSDGKKLAPFTYSRPKVKPCLETQSFNNSDLYKYNGLWTDHSRNVPKIDSDYHYVS